MKIYLKPSAVMLFIALLLLSCRSDSQENPRAYVEGKVISATVDYNKFLLKIISESTIVAETMLASDGNFKLSGPIGKNGFDIVSTEKIKTFSTDKTGPELSSDGLKILVPAGITYIKFNEIVLEK